MNTEIINVLNYLCEKIGVAIDWTSENVMPQVMDILGRYRIMRLILNSIWMVVTIGILIVFAILWSKAFAARRTALKEHKSNAWWSYYSFDNSVIADGALPLTIISIFVCIPAIIIIIAVADGLFKWLLVPEIKYLELIQTYIQ